MYSKFLLQSLTDELIRDHLEDLLKNMNIKDKDHGSESSYFLKDAEIVIRMSCDKQPKTDLIKFMVNGAYEGTYTPIFDGDLNVHNLNKTIMNKLLYTIAPHIVTEYIDDVTAFDDENISDTFIDEMLIKYFNDKEFLQDDRRYIDEDNGCFIVLASDELFNRVKNRLDVIYPTLV